MHERGTKKHRPIQKRSEIRRSTFTKRSGVCGLFARPRCPGESSACPDCFSGSLVPGKSGSPARLCRAHSPEGDEVPFPWHAGKIAHFRWLLRFWDALQEETILRLDHLRRHRTCFIVIGDVIDPTAYG